jgi:citrate lyase subunit gamma (acyl carrier protein)
MEIKKSAFSGTLESSDAYIEIEPSKNGLSLDIESIVLKQFGEQIKTTVLSVLDEFEVKNANVKVLDRGALECVIRARVETAILRSKEEN